MACDLAVSIAKENPGNSIVITPGGCAGKEWDHVWKGGLMGKYIKAQTKARVVKQMANTFDMFGEISTVTYTVLHLCHCEKCISEIVFTVRARQAARAKFICRQLLNKLNLRHIPVSTRTYDLPFGWRKTAQEYVGAWPKTFFASRLLGLTSLYLFSALTRVSEKIRKKR